MSDQHADEMDAYEILQATIDDLPISVRTCNLMRTHGIYSLEEFLQRSRDEVRGLRGMQKKVWNEIDDLLVRHGLGIGRWE